MAEVIRLQIVYETAQATSNLTRLERGQRGASIAAIHLAQGFAQGNISAVTLARSVEHLGGSIGALATGIALAGAVFVLWSNFLDNSAKQAATMAKEIATAKVEMDALLGIEETSTEAQIRKITDRIKELRDELNKPGFWDKVTLLFSGIATGGFLGRGVTGVTPIGTAVTPEKSPLQKQVDILEKQLAVLLRLDQSQQAIARGIAPGGIGAGRFHDTRSTGLAIGFKAPERGPFGGGFQSARGLDLTTHPATPLVDPVVEGLTRQQERIFQSWEDGLHTMQDSLEEFLVTGKFVFQQLIDDLLRIAFRAATDQFVDKAVKGVFDVAQKSSGFRKQMSGG